MHDGLVDAERTPQPPDGQRRERVVGNRGRPARAVDVTARQVRICRRLSDEQRHDRNVPTVGGQVQRRQVALVAQILDQRVLRLGGQRRLGVRRDVLKKLPRNLLLAKEGWKCKKYLFMYENEK